ncbi:MAG TPA: glycosyltransferase, partial [Chitinophagaceae bacterium]|nr:glycosyltransferase [Chitinophagaceae bacterium]
KLNNNKQRHIIIFLYNSYNDPLCQGLLVKYCKELVLDGDKFFHIISFEQPQYRLSVEEVLLEKRKLAERNINWYPLQFHTGRFLLVKKGYDCLRGILKAIRIKYKHKCETIVAFANIAGSMSYLIAKLTGMRLVVFSYEPHSLFLKELGCWKESSLKFKLLRFLEVKLGRNADVVITGTRYMIDHLQMTGVKGKLYRLPTSVDSDLFKFDEIARSSIRQKFGLNDKRVVIYTGKFGDLYYKDEIFEVAATLYNSNRLYFFIFLTGHDKDEITELFDRYKIPAESYWIGRVPHEEVSQFLSAADIGLVTVADFPSRKYCSPTKVGEYLCCGLPYIVTRGTSEDDIYAEVYNVGVVVEKFSRSGVLPKLNAINDLLAEPKEQLAERCRQTGVAYRGYKNAIQLFQKIL